MPFLLLQMATTGLAEEPGWRDFALVRHQRQQGPLLGTLILGVLWAVWHFPLLVTEWGRGISGATPQAILLFTAFCVAISVFITWLCNRTNESLAVVMLAHVSVNNFASVMFLATIPGSARSFGNIPNPRPTACGPPSGWLSSDAFRRSLPRRRSSGPR